MRVLHRRQQPGGLSGRRAIGKYGVLPCSLVWGDAGPGTLALQWALNDCYLAPAGKALLSDDAAFGQLTFNALKFAQSKAGITADGQFGPQSRASLKFPAFTGGTSEPLPVPGSAVRLAVTAAG